MFVKMRSLLFRQSENGAKHTQNIHSYEKNSIEGYRLQQKACNLFNYSHLIFSVF